MVDDEDAEREEEEEEDIGDHAWSEDEGAWCGAETVHVCRDVVVDGGKI